MFNQARVVHQQGIGASKQFLPPQPIQGNEDNIFCFCGFGLRKKARGKGNRN
jgi:hypothetical protein